MSGLRSRIFFGSCLKKYWQTLWIVGASGVKYLRNLASLRDLYLALLYSFLSANCSCSAICRSMMSCVGSKIESTQPSES